MHSSYFRERRRKAFSRILHYPHTGEATRRKRELHRFFFNTLKKRMLFPFQCPSKIEVTGY
jgi:hypothetical protein